MVGNNLYNIVLLQVFIIVLIIIIFCIVYKKYKNE